jgi:spore germination protein YaaH
LQHEVWFEDAESIRQNSLLIRLNGIANIGIWELGSGDLTDFLASLHQPPSVLR